MIDAESLEAPAIVAAAIGMPIRRDASAAGWSTEPFVWSTPGLAGKIEFKSQRAVLLPGVATQQLSGVARFNAAEIVFEEISGEMAKGRLEGRLAVANGSDGMSARVRFALLDADPGALFAGAERPAMSGKLVMQTELEGGGRSPAAFMGSLTGFGNVTLERAQLGGLNPGVFGAVNRAIELGVPLGGNRIREFVTGMLDNGPLPVTRASARIGISAGQARFSDIAVQSTGAELQASASVDLSDATLDARLSLNGLPPSPGAQRPAVLIALKGALPSPQRTVDVSLLTSWLTLRAVEQQSKQIDAMEQAARDAATRANPTTQPVRAAPRRCRSRPMHRPSCQAQCRAAAQARKRRRCRLRSTFHPLRDRGSRRGPKVRRRRAAAASARPSRRAELTPAAACIGRRSRAIAGSGRRRRDGDSDRARTAGSPTTRLPWRRSVSIVDTSSDRVEAAIVGDFLEALPEGVFETDAGLVACDDDGTLDNGRFHRRSPGSIRC